MAKATVGADLRLTGSHIVNGVYGTCGLSLPREIVEASIDPEIERQPRMSESSPLRTQHTVEFLRKHALQRREMPTQTNCAVVNQFIEEGINLGKIDSIAQFVWEDVVEQVPFPGQGPGLEGLKDVLRGMRAAFPDLHFSVEEQMAEGDKVLTRFEWAGTHRGDFLGVHATGRFVKVWGMVLDRLEEGRIKDTRIIMDIFGLMMQLEAFAPKT
jgi:steroid delta-isomerase-like uncharacterized protein